MKRLIWAGLTTALAAAVVVGGCKNSDTTGQAAQGAPGTTGSGSAAIGTTGNPGGTAGGPGKGMLDAPGSHSTSGDAASRTPSPPVKGGSLPPHS